MSKVALFLIEGFEETEALTTVDILRRGEVEVTMVSLSKEKLVRGKHDISVMADAMFSEIETQSFDMLVIPGGTTAYLDHEGLLALVKKQNHQQKKLAAICAAPAVFGKLRLLDGKKALIYPGMESYLAGAMMGTGLVETDGNITTSKGPGTTVPFALRLLELLQGAACAKQVKEKFLA